MSASDVTAACQTVSVDEAAQRLGFNRNTIYAAIQAGELQVVRFGRKIRIPIAVLDRMLSRDAIGAELTALPMIGSRHN